LRLKEASKLGFRRAVAPPPPGDKSDDAPKDMALQRCGHISALVAEIAATAPKANPQRERGRRSEAAY
jgi:DNA repair protein RadA/Sms